MSKKTKVLILLFVILGGLSYFLLNKKETNTTLLESEIDFAVPKDVEITRFFIADRNGQQADLKKQKDGTWLFNDKYLANENKVKDLLDVLHTIEIKYRPANASIENIIKNIASKGIRVEIFSSGDKKIKSYYIGGGDVKETGTYAIKDGANSPVVVTRKGFLGNIRMSFVFNEKYWKSKYVFHENVSNIQSIKLTYPKQPENSFILDLNQPDNLQIQKITSKKAVSKVPISGNVDFFLSRFESKIAEAFATSKNIDSLVQLTPFCIVDIKRKDDSQRKVTFYPIYSEDIDGNLVHKTRSMKRYYTLTTDGDLFNTQNYVMKDIFWYYDLFFKKNTFDEG